MLDFLDLLPQAYSIFDIDLNRDAATGFFIESADGGNLLEDRTATMFLNDKQ